MKLDLQENMYVRTKYGIIDKIIIDYNGKCNNPNCNCKHVSCTCNYYDENDIIKASFNIIDILEVGDVLYLLDKEYGEKYKAKVVLDDNDVKSIVNYEQCDLLNLEYELITEEHIKVLQILTKEQFEQISYKLGE